MPGRDDEKLPGRRARESASPTLQTLMDLGIRQSTDGGLYVPADALRQMRADRVRATTTPRVPSTVRHMQREAGGVAASKTAGRWGELSFAALRKLRNQSPITQVIHKTRDYQVSRMARRFNGRPGDVGWRVRHRDFRDERRQPPESIRRKIATAEIMLEKPSPIYCKSLGQALSQLEEDYLTINRPTVELLRWDVNPNVVVGWRPVDGALIWPTMHFLEKWWADNPGWAGRHRPVDLSVDDALDLMATKLGHDVGAAEYALVRDGVLEGTYRPGELLCEPRLSRTDIAYAGYPPSHVEEAAETILAFISTWGYNAGFFTKGFMAEFMIAVSGNVHDDDLDAFVELLRQSTQGYKRAHQPPILPLPEAGAVSKIDFKANNTEMQFEVWFSALWSLCCGHYRMDPSSTNGKPWGGGTGPSLSEGNRHMEISLAKEEGLQGDLEHLNTGILTPLVQRIDPLLFVEYEYGDIEAKREAETHEVQLRTTRTPNEVRLQRGDAPIGYMLETRAKYDAASDEEREKHDANPYNDILNPAIGQAKQQAALRDQMQGGDDGYGGAPQGGPPQGPPQGGAPLKKGSAIVIRLDDPYAS